MRAILAVPMRVLRLVAGGVCWLNDGRRSRRRGTEPQWDDDETSPLDA
jgi:hypothetical protein